MLRFWILVACCLSLSWSHDTPSALRSRRLEEADANPLMGADLDAMQRSRSLLGFAPASIPVTFVVVQGNSGEGDVPNAIISEYVSHLNSGLNQYGFSFAFKQTKRVQNSSWRKCTNDVNNNLDPQRFDNFQEIAEEMRDPSATSNDLFVYLCQTPSSGFAFPPEATGFSVDGVALDSDLIDRGNERFINQRKEIILHEFG